MILIRNAVAFILRAEVLRLHALLTSGDPSRHDLICDLIQDQMDQIYYFEVRVGMMAAVELIKKLPGNVS